MAGQSLHFRIGQNDEQWFFVPFPISQVIVDNPGTYWVHFPEAWGGYAFVWPQRFGAAVPAPVAGPGNLHVTTKDTPPGQAPAGASTAIATLTVYEDTSALQPEGGQAAPSFNPGQALQTLDSVAGDIRPVSQNAVAGNVGLASDAGHVHPGGVRLAAAFTDVGPLPASHGIGTVYTRPVRYAVWISGTVNKITAAGKYAVKYTIAGVSISFSRYSSSFGVKVPVDIFDIFDLSVVPGNFVIDLDQGPGASSSDANDTFYSRLLEWPLPA